MKRNALLILMFSGLLLSCSTSTYLVKSWTDPDYSKSSPQPFKKILVAARLTSPANNKMAEDKMVKQLPAAVQSYSYIQPADTTLAMVEQKLEKDGFDAVILMKLMEIHKTPSYMQGFSYGGVFGLQSGTPESWPVDKSYIVETDIYTSKTGKPVWSGTTSTMNPEKVDKALDEIIKAVKKELKKMDLIQH